MKRVHRTFLERFRYLAIHECPSCDVEEYVPRRYTYHFGDTARCPACGTYRLVKLREPDKIDPMNRGPLNLLERLYGGKLFHCCFCRVQFYDRRPMADRRQPEAAPVEPVASQPNTAALSDS